MKKLILLLFTLIITQSAFAADVTIDMLNKLGKEHMVYSKKIVSAVEKNLKGEFSNTVFILGMRYGNPSLEDALEEMKKQKVRRLLDFPLYPQYCASTTASTFDKITNILQKWRWIPEIRFINNYFEEDLYIKAVSDSIKDKWKELGKPQKTVFSYHGIPLSYLMKGDPYHCYCLKTTRLVKEELGLNDEDVMTTFQSRFGSQEWLQPYTDETLKKLPDQGIKDIHILSPGFSVDCLETIEEIGEENRDYFMKAGGNSYHYIKCLNDSKNHINMISAIIKKHSQGWKV